MAGLGVTFKYKDHHLIEGHARTPQRVGGFVLPASKPGRQLAAPPSGRRERSCSVEQCRRPAIEKETPN
jgi:hypothetical protein